MNRLSIAIITCIIVVCTTMGGCATNPHNDRAQFVAPPVVSEVYSRANLQFMLVSTSSVPSGCGDADCFNREQFERRVAGVGARLAAAAYQAYPGLAERVPGFDFSVVDKAEPGTVSTAGGQVVVLRPVSTVAPGEEALAFVIAREIGHVVGRHHDENTGASLVVSALATVLMPVANIAKFLATLFSGATTTTASVSVTAASYAGSKALIESYRPRQREEADQIAMKLVAQLGFDARSVAAGFAFADPLSPATRWMGDLRTSVERLASPANPTAALAAVPYAVLVQAASPAR